jgi:hypothetical protein
MDSLYLVVGRLYPPVPFERKEAVNDDTLPNGIQIPK